MRVLFSLCCLLVSLFLHSIYASECVCVCWSVWWRAFVWRQTAYNNAKAIINLIFPSTEIELQAGETETEQAEEAKGETD